MSPSLEESQASVSECRVIAHAAGTGPLKVHFPPSQSWCFQCLYFEMVILSDTLSVARQRQAASCSYYYLLSMNQMSAMLLLANMYSGFPAGSVVKNFFTVQEMWVRSPGWEDPLEKEMATHSSILAWEIPWTRGAWWSTVHGVAKVGHYLVTKQPHLFSAWHILGIVLNYIYIYIHTYIYVCIYIVIYLILKTSQCI